MEPGVTRIAGISLPVFSRLSWAGGAARAAWEPRLLEVAERWIELVIAVTRAGAPPVLPVAAGADVSHKLRAAAARKGLAVAAAPPVPGVRPLPWHARPRRSTRAAPKPLVVGRPDAVRALGEAARGDDVEGVRRLLDVPACCARGIQEGWTDPWWPLAVRSAAALGTPAKGHRIDLPEGTSRQLVLRALHLPAVWFEPCTLVCPAAAERAGRLREAMLPGELACVDAVAGWSVAWSGLHGIAELKTPVFKRIEPTDPTAENLVVRLRGRDVPEGAARGVRFPYVQRRRVPVRTRSG